MTQQQEVGGNLDSATFVDMDGPESAVYQLHSIGLPITKVPTPNPLLTSILHAVSLLCRRA